MSWVQAATAALAAIAVLASGAVVYFAVKTRQYRRRADAALTRAMRGWRTRG